MLTTNTLFAAVSVVAFVIGYLFGRGDISFFYNKGYKDGAKSMLDYMLSSAKDKKND